MITFDNLKNASNLKKVLFILTIFIFSIGLCCFKNLPDNDLWARIIAGAHFTELHSVLKNDFLSYTPTHTWYDHEWGASVFFYNAYKYFGAAGLIVLKGIMLALTLVFCFLTINLRKLNSTTPYNILYYFLMCVCALNTVGNTIRCLLFTCLFFAAFIYILERARLGKNKTLILLPFIMLVWSNIHGGCISGLGILAVYAFGEFLNGNEWKKYIYTLLFSIAALFINPYGFEYVKFLFSAASMNRAYIAEWLSPFFPSFMYVYLKYKFCLILMLFVYLFSNIKNKTTFANLDKTKLLVVLMMTFLSVTHIRHINFFVFTICTLLYEEFYFTYNFFAEKIQKTLNLKTESNSKVFSTKEVIIYCLLLLVFLPALGNKKLIQISETNCPRFAIEFVKINELKGNLFINFDWGSYAAYKLYPANLIVMDGRYEEVYNPELLMEIKDFHLVQNDWKKIIRDYKTDVMILEKRYPVFEKILADKDWTLVFENNLTGVFVPADKVKESYLYPVPDSNYYDETVLDTDIDFVRPIKKIVNTDK